MARPPDDESPRPRSRFHRRRWIAVSINVRRCDVVRLRADSRGLPARNRMGSPHQFRKILPGDRLFLEEGGDDDVEAVTIVAEQDACPLLGFREQAADLLVDDLLGALGIGTFLAERVPPKCEDWSDP